MIDDGIERVTKRLKESIKLLTLAKNVETPPETLSSLSESNDINVVRLVASNTNTPAETLYRLALSGKDVGNIALLVSQNPSTPTKVLDFLGVASSHWETRKNVALHKNTPPSFLHRLAKDRDAEVRRGLAKNPNTLDVTLEILVKDFDPNVGIAAMHNPNIRPRTQVRGIVYQPGLRSGWLGKPLKINFKELFREALCQLGKNIS